MTNFLYFVSHQMNFHLKNFQNCWWMLIALLRICSLHVWTTTRSSLIFQFFANFIISLCANISQLPVVGPMEKGHIFQQTPKIHQKCWKLLTWSSFDEIAYITQLLYFLNNNYGNFCLIWSIEVSISPQENVF